MDSTAEAAEYVTHSVLSAKGETSALLRTKIRDAAKAKILGEKEPELDAAIADLVGAIVHKPVSADVAALAKTGLTEDAIFEIVIAAAQGKGEGRLERGLAALRKK